jgi:hypothetical protein
MTNAMFCTLWRLLDSGLFMRVLRGCGCGLGIFSGCRAWCGAGCFSSQPERLVTTLLGALNSGAHHFCVPAVGF